MGRLFFLLLLGAAVMAGAWYWSVRNPPVPERWLGDDGFYRVSYASPATRPELTGVLLLGVLDAATAPQASETFDLKDGLFHDPDSPVGGNPQGEITIVEFFDYRCAYCKAVAPKLARLVERHGRIRVIYKEWPILGGASELAAKAALAAHRQGRYEAFHRRMMAVKSLPTMALIRSVAEKLGLDWIRLQQDMADPRLDDAVARTKRLAKRIGIVGTPAFVAGDTIVQGAVPPEELLSLAQSVDIRPDPRVETSDTPSAR